MPVAEVVQRNYTGRAIFHGVIHFVVHLVTARPNVPFGTGGVTGGLKKYSLTKKGDQN